MNTHWKANALWLACLLACNTSATAETFSLGEVTVNATKPQIGEIGGGQASSAVTQQDMKQFNRDNVGDALNLLSGVTLTNSGMRNEKMIYVRGFDPRQAPLFIDGIPVYVPYDGYVDLNRFTTADLAAIQVSKGFSSVTYGANTLGGAINLISRKPKEKLEGDASLGIASGNERQAQVNVGSNQGLWYVQSGLSYLQSDNFPLSADFIPTATENGGARDNSNRKDSKISLKLGLTPNTSDEYALSYYKQDGEKGQPPSTGAGARYWKWPLWNKQSLYFVSKTALGDKETVKTRLYWDKFDNGLDIYTNATYSTIASPVVDRSTYDDSTRGGSIEVSSTRLSSHELKLTGHYKVDKHISRDGAAAVTESFQDTLSSYAAEDNIALTPTLLLSLGLAQHSLNPQEVYKPGSPFTLPGTKTVTDTQTGLFYDYTPDARLYATIAQKSRLPTLKDRYSARFSTYLENTALRPEASLNYEIGYQGKFFGNTKGEAALYVSDITDKIQTAYQAGSSVCTAGSKCQMQNIGKTRATGLELGLRNPLSSNIELGGNYTLSIMENVSDPVTKLTGIPRHKLIAHALYKPAESVDLISLAEYNSSRWASNTVELPEFTILSLKAVYRATKSISAEAGVNNLTDKNYSLADGYPSAGRTWFVNSSLKF